MKIVKIGATAAAISSIIGLMWILGFDFPPWPAKAELIQLAGNLEKTVETQQELTKELLLLRRDYYIGIEEKAEADLQVNPSSSSAKRELRRAQDSIKQIDEALKK